MGDTHKDEVYLFNLLLQNAMEAELTLLHWCLRGRCSLFSDHQQVRYLCNINKHFLKKKKRKKRKLNNKVFTLQLTILKSTTAF